MFAYSISSLSKKCLAKAASALFAKSTYAIPFGLIIAEITSP